MTSAELLAKIVKEEITIRVRVPLDMKGNYAEVSMYPHDWTLGTYNREGRRLSSLSGDADTIYAEMKRLEILP